MSQRRRSEDRNRGQSAMTAWRWKGPSAKECRQPLKTGEGKDTDVPLDLQKECSPATLNVSPVRPTSDF